MKKQVVGAMVAAVALGMASSAPAAIEYDQDVTPDLINGSGNDNGAFTTDRDNGVELGLRGKLRHNASGNPENTFNSNGDGTYTFNVGVAPGQSLPTAEWSFEWSINTDYLGTSGLNLNDFNYVLGLDTDPGLGTSFITFDPIHDVNPGTGTVQWDHAMGDNSTGNGGGVSISNSSNDAAGYATNIDTYNVAQQSWKPHWFIPGFDPNVEGTYDFYLAAFDGNGAQVARTDIQIGAVVPIPGAAGLGLLGLGLIGAHRRFRKKA